VQTSDGDYDFEVKNLAEEGEWDIALLSRLITGYGARSSSK
jgi:hypothetical protein